MKRVIITLTLAASVLLIASCSGGYTCPTYMKIDDQQMEKIDDTQVEATERV